MFGPFERQGEHDGCCGISDRTRLKTLRSPG